MSDQPVQAMTEKPEPVSAWAVAKDGCKLNISGIYNDKSYAADIVERLNAIPSLGNFRVIPVTITAKDE